MQSVRLEQNDMQVINMLNSAQKFDKGEVIVEAIQQTMQVIRSQVEDQLEQSDIKQTGQSKWSKKYGTPTKNIRQSKKINVEKYLRGKISLMYDARLRWFEKGTYKSKPRLTTGKGKRYGKQKSSGTIRPLRFMKKQNQMIKEKQIATFNKTLKQGLEREMKKIEKR